MKRNIHVVKPIGLLVCIFCSLHSVCAQSWSEMGVTTGAFNQNVQSIAIDPQGNIYAAGLFYVTNPLRYYVVKWNGSTWVELGTGSNSLNADYPINALTTDAAGNIYAAGTFTDNSGKGYVAKWDGTTWTELGTGANALEATDVINAIAADTAGNIYAAGNFADYFNKPYVAKWNGSTWTELGGSNGGFNNIINAIAVDRSGNVYAGGFFQDSARYYVAKCSSSGTWTDLGMSSMVFTNSGDFINAICTDAAGNVYVAGGITNASGKHYVAKWDGTAWTEPGSGSSPLNASDQVMVLAADANNNIYAGGDFRDTTGYRYVAKWNGTTWSELGTGPDALNANGPILAINLDNSGNVYAGGGFMNSVSMEYVAEYSATTGVSRLERLENNIKIFPNPASGQLTIAAVGNLVVTDIAGRIIYAGLLTKQDNSINTANWADGTYLCIVYSGDGKSTGKIVVNH
jgi:hypothetical protein